MHGLSHSTTFTRILALDLGKFTSVLCVYDPATHDHHFVSAQTRRPRSTTCSSRTRLPIPCTRCW